MLFSFLLALLCDERAFCSSQQFFPPLFVSAEAIHLFYDAFSSSAIHFTSLERAATGRIIQRGFRALFESFVSAPILLWPHREAVKSSSSIRPFFRAHKSENHQNQ